MHSAHEPPIHLEAERCFLACCVQHPAAVLAQARRLARPEDLHYPAHRAIFDAAETLWNQAHALDLFLLTDALRKAGELSAVGGPAVLSALFTTTVPEPMAAYHAAALRETSALRGIWQTCGRLAREAGLPTAEPRTMAAELTELLARLAAPDAGHKTMAEHIDEALERYEQAWQNRGKRAPGVIPTGLADLDAELDGGLYPGDFAVLAAETSGGKTALAMNAVCYGVLEVGASAMVASYEMKASQLVDRLVALAAELPANKLRGGTFNEGEFQRLTRAVTKLRASHLHLRDRIGRWTVDDVASEARAIRARHGLGLVVVDYLQLMAPRPAGRGRQVNREREVADMSRALKDLAIELDVPVVALSQLNDDGKLRESRAVGQDADVVLTIGNDYEAGDTKRERPRDDLRMIRVNKNRNGRRDQAVRVTWDGPLMRFGTFVNATVKG